MHKRLNQSESAISNDAWGSRASSEGHEGGKLAPRAQGLLRCLGGDIPRGGAGIALAFRLCVFGLHHSRGRGGCPSVLAVASLKETRGLLSRFDCVYSDYITQGCPGGALAVAVSLRARCAFFPTHCDELGLRGDGSRTSGMDRDKGNSGRRNRESTVRRRAYLHDQDRHEAAYLTYAHSTLVCPA